MFFKFGLLDQSNSSIVIFYSLKKNENTSVSEEPKVGLTVSNKWS